MPAPVHPGFLVGTGMSVSIDDVLVYASGGNFARSVVEIKVSNSRSGCFQVVAPGIKSGVLNLNLRYNGADPAPVLDVGQYCEALLDSAGAACVPEGLEGRVFTIPMMITQITDTWENEGEYNWSLTASTHGEWTVIEPDAT